MFDKLKLRIEYRKIDKVLSRVTCSQFSHALARAVSLPVSHNPSPFEENRCCLIDTYYFALGMVAGLLRMRPELSPGIVKSEVSSFSSCIQALLLAYHRLPVDIVDLFFQDRIPFYESVYQDAADPASFVSDMYSHFQQAIVYDSEENNFSTITEPFPVMIRDFLGQMKKESFISQATAAYQSFIVDRVSVLISACLVK